MDDPGRLQILVVAENADVLESLVGELRPLVGEAGGIECARNVAVARRALQSVKPSALIVDQDLRAGGAAAFARLALRLGRRSPTVFMIGALNATDKDVVRLIREHPEIHFIERPFRPDVAARRIRTVLIPTKDSDQSFYGLRLCELIQAFSLSRRDATLLVLTPDGRMGSVAIQAGRLIHVSFGDLEGMDALLHMVDSKKGEIRVDPDCLTAKHTIAKPTQQVLIEVYRRLDEARMGAPSRKEYVDSDATTPTGRVAREHEDRQIMAQLDAMFVEDDPGGDVIAVPPAVKEAIKQGARPDAPPRVPPGMQPIVAPEDPSAESPGPPPKVHPPWVGLIHSTYRGLSSEVFSQKEGARFNGAAGTRSKSTTSFRPKDLPPKTVGQMLDEALLDDSAGRGKDEG